MNKLEVDKLDAWFGETRAVKSISLAVPPCSVTAIIGPSGCGKSTFVRCLNRMHELTPSARSEGRVLLDGEDVYAVDPVYLRRRVGMVFQRPNVFPTMSISDNVLSGLRLNRVRAERDGPSVAVALRRLEAAAQDARANLMPPIMDCVRAYATLGEMCHVLRRVFGEFTEQNLV